MVPDHQTSEKLFQRQLSLITNFESKAVYSLADTNSTLTPPDVKIYTLDEPFP